MTTAFGFLSLTTSQLQPVVQFGLLSAIGMLISISALLILFIPATRIPDAGPTSEGANRVEPMWFVEPILELAGFRATGIVLGSMLLMAIFAGGLLRLQSTTRFDGMFQPEHPSVASLRWIEKHVSPIESLEFIIGFPKDSEAVDPLEQLGIVTHLQQSLGRHEKVHSTFAANCVLPAIPRQQGLRATIQRSIFRRMLVSDLDTLVNAQLVSHDPTAVLWRVTARFKTSTDTDFHQLQSELEALARSELQTKLSEMPGEATLEVTGLRAVIETANTALINDLIISFATAFLLITPAMMVVARSVWGGLLLMLPNLLPVTLVFGAMGWFSVPLDVASILTASVALGISVDDTLHCTHWYLRNRGSGKSARQAIGEALRKCARPMFHTTMICTAAMAPFLFSEFLPTGRFAVLMILILVGAIASDLILLPSIVCSPLGSWIGSREKKTLAPID